MGQALRGRGAGICGGGEGPGEEPGGPSALQYAHFGHIVREDVTARGKNVKGAEDLQNTERKVPVMHEINHLQHLHGSECVGTHLRRAVLGQSIESAACHCGPKAFCAVVWLASCAKSKREQMSATGSGKSRGMAQTPERRFSLPLKPLRFRRLELVSMGGPPDRSV